MRVVFLGTPDAAVPALQRLLDTGIDVGLVVSQPDRPSGRSRRPVETPVKRAARRSDIAVFQPSKVRNAAFLERISAAAADAIVVVAYGRILPLPVLESASLGAVNLHFSLLPAYRGAAPVQWALVHGENLTGVTTMRMSEGLDEGAILLSREAVVEPGEHAPALQRRLAAMGAELLVETLQRLERGDLTPTPQDDSRATFAPPIRTEDGEIDPALPANAIEGRIRGFDPWPGVWLSRGGRRIRLAAGEAIGERAAAPPGTLEELRSDGLVLACGERSRLLLRQIQVEGRRVLQARDAVNGRQLGVGERLERIRRDE